MKNRKIGADFFPYGQTERWTDRQTDGQILRS